MNWLKSLYADTSRYAATLIVLGLNVIGTLAVVYIQRH